jgi:DNA-binding transcriptional MerR regulator
MKSRLLISEFADLTHVTVRTLHYYDQVGLLQPSVRRPNGYRLYTEKDLLRLQQIVALKFLGFSLEEIKRLLGRSGLPVRKSLAVQARVIDEEVRRLRRASRALRAVAESLKAEKKIDWKKIIKIIEVIQMSEETKKNWAERFFSEDELKEFQELGQKFTPEQIQAYQQKWAALIQEVQQNLNADPASEIAIDLARRWQDLFDSAYGEHPNLKNQIAKAYQAGVIPAEYRMFGPEVWDFICRATKARREKGR